VELILEFLGSFFFDLLLELLIDVGWESFRHVERPRRQANPVLAVVGLLLLGSMAGCGTVVVLPRRIVPPGPFPGIGVFLSPIATGLAMRAYGRWATARGRDPSFLATFWGGTAFAFGASLTRWILLGWYGQR